MLVDTFYGRGFNYKIMEDLQVINDIVNQSVKETSYWSVIISSSVFIIYTLIVRVIDYFKNKDKDKPLMEMSKAIKEVSNNVVKLNLVLDKMIQDNSKKDVTKCKNSIELSFISFEHEVEKLCRDIIIHNNIETNKDMIIRNIAQKVNTEYYKVYSVLSLYEVKDVCVANHLHTEWIDDICKTMTTIIFNNQDKDNRCNQVTNSLKLIMNGYSTQVYNKTFN